MDKEKLVSHFENLVPGIVTLFLAATLVPTNAANPIKNTALLGIIQQPFIAGCVFISLSYLAGVIIFVVSRFVVDTLSAILPRWIMLLIFEWGEFKGMRMPWQVNAKYREELAKAYRKQEWQAEIDKRRERGRLIRTNVVPVALILANLIHWPWACIISVATVTVVYSYSEVSLFKELKLVAIA